MVDINLQKKTAEMTGENRYFASLSFGADSLAALLAVKEAEVLDIQKGAYYYYYFAPNLKFVEEYRNYIQDFFNIKVTMLPSFVLTNNMPTCQYQDPAGTYALCKLQSSKNCFYKTEKSILAETMRCESGMLTAFEGVGIKQGDSPDRRIYLRKCEGLNEAQKKWFPIWNFENGDVVKIIKRHGLKMPICYNLSGISTENVDYRFSEPARRFYPALYEKMMEIFPCLDQVKARIEKYRPDYIHPKKGVFYGKFDILLPSDCEKLPPVEKRERVKREKPVSEEFSMREFRKLATDRMEFELQVAPLIHLVFKGENEKSAFVKKHNLSLKDGKFIFSEDMPKLFAEKSGFDLDLNLELDLDLDFNFDSNQANTKKDDLETACDKELASKFVDLDKYRQAFYKKYGTAYITVLFETGADVDKFVEKHKVNVKYRDIIIM